MPASPLTARIAERAQREGVTLTTTALSELAIFIGLLTKWNAKVNLTALALEPLSDQALDRLLIEAVVAGKEVRSSDRLLIDVGSGGGSPAVPLKATAPVLRLVMVESRARKSAFLREVVRELGWSDASVETSRLEDLARRTDHPQADLVSLRAVRADDQLWKNVTTLLSPSGRVLWFGGSAEEAHVPPGLKVVGSRRLGQTGTGLVVLQR